jgi:hypothetical protein
VKEREGWREGGREGGRDQQVLSLSDDRFETRGRRGVNPKRKSLTLHGRGKWQAVLGCRG